MNFWLGGGGAGVSDFLFLICFGGGVGGGVGGSRWTDRRTGPN